MMINETLRLIRVIHDLSATDLAKELNISVSKLSKIEKYASIFNTTSSVLLLFAEHLDVEKKRSKMKISIRNKMFKLLQILGDCKDEKDNKKDTSGTKSSV